MKRLHLIYFVDAASTKTTSFRISSIVMFCSFVTLLIVTNLFLFLWFLKTKKHVDFLEQQNKDLKVSVIRNMSKEKSVAEAPGLRRVPMGLSTENQLSKEVVGAAGPVLPQVAQKATASAPVASAFSYGSSPVSPAPLLPLKITNGSLLETGNTTVMQADLENTTEGRRVVGWVCGLLGLRKGGGALTTSPPGLALDKSGVPMTCKGGQPVSFQRLRPTQILFSVPLQTVERAVLFFESKEGGRVLSFPIATTSKGNNELP